jgi:hypothetical protein
MSSTEIVEFAIKLSAVWWDKLPVATIFVDNELIAEITVEK